MNVSRSTVAWVAVVLVGAADVATTHVGLSVGLMEGNPLVAPAVEQWGSWFLVAFKALVIAGVYAVTWPLPRPAPAVTAEAIATVWMFAVGWNLALIHPSAVPHAALTGVVFTSTAGVVFTTASVTKRLSRRAGPSQDKAGVGA